MDWSVPAFTILAMTAAGLLAVLSMRYRRDRRVFMESKDLVSGVVRVFSGRLKKQEELLDALNETTHHMLKTQEEQQSRLEKITDQMTQSMDVERRLIGALARLGEKVNRLLSGSVTEEKGKPPEKLTAEGYMESMKNALSRLTPTELKVLELLVAEGPLPSPSVGRTVGKSREHTARLMKRLYEQGYVDRETSRIPYRYRVNEKVRGVFEKQKDKTKQKVEQQAQGKQTA